MINLPIDSPIKVQSLHINIMDTILLGTDKFCILQ